MGQDVSAPYNPLYFVNHTKELNPFDKKVYLRTGKKKDRMKVAIIGGSGYTGGELLRILAGYPGVDIETVTSRQFAGKNVSTAHPNLEGILDIKFEEPELSRIAENVDFVFTATPHGKSMDIVPTFADVGLKVVDLSGDFRFRDLATYERYYGHSHSHPELEAVYGLPELHRDEIKDAQVVANPGCYPTSVILGLVPLLKEELIDIEKIAVDSKSGVSGAGIKPKAPTMYTNVAEAVTPYRITAHQHLPEIEQELRYIAPEVKVSFVPHVVPVIRGISSTIHGFLEKDIVPEELRAAYVKHYEGEPFVRILGPGEIPRMSSVRGSNYIDIGGFGVDPERDRTIVISVIDNLVKGASGQAVQNMNIMCGFEETAGLIQIGVHP
jgi:N-acetyl-gamma-glutamyl-phosphate reductase